MCFRWELNSRSFIIAEAKMEKQLPKKVICFRRELNSRPFIMAEVGNYLENRSNGNKYSNLLIDGWIFLIIVRISRVYLFPSASCKQCILLYLQLAWWPTLIARVSSFLFFIFLLNLYFGELNSIKSF